jgi:FMN phosphatase YigB (HAD superfamily)
MEAVPPFKAYILDCDDTILDFAYTERQAFLEVYPRIAAYAPGEGAERLLERFIPINKATWADADKGLFPAREIPTKRFERLLPGADREALASIGAAYLEAMSRHALYLACAEEALRRLKSRDALLALGTNGFAAVQRGRISASGLGSYLDAIVISEEIGLRKPDPAFFQACLLALNDAAAVHGLDTRFRSSEVLVVGDNPRADIDAAMRAGFPACWVAPRSAFWPLDSQAPMYRVEGIGELG